MSTEAGQNFGWSLAEGPCDPDQTDCSDKVDPARYWNRRSGHPYRKDDDDAEPSTKRCAWVGVPYEPTEADPYEGFLDDSILFSDMCVGYVRALSVDENNEVVRDDHVGHLVGLSSAAQGPDGYLYVTSYGSCSAATAGVGGGIFRVLPRTAEGPAIVEPDLPTSPLVDDPLGPFPARISQTGIFTDDALTTPIDRVVHYEPTHALWSNGSEKTRWLLLPEGTQVDNTDRQAWDFPPGTLFWKTFAFEGGSPERVETRIIRRTDTGYDYHVYKWDQDGADATLLSLEDIVRVTVTMPDDSVLRHRIPSRFDCRSCHESNPTVIIGFDSALEWPRAGEPESQLTELAEADIFEQALPADPELIAHADPATQAVLGYLKGNCAHCHNASSQTMSVLSLEPEVALSSVVSVPTMGSGQAQGIRVVPQSPKPACCSWPSRVRPTIRRFRPCHRSGSRSSMPMPSSCCAAGSTRSRSSEAGFEPRRAMGLGGAP